MKITIKQLRNIIKEEVGHAADGFGLKFDPETLDNETLAGDFKFRFNVGTHVEGDEIVVHWPEGWEKFSRQRVIDLLYNPHKAR